MIWSVCRFFFCASRLLYSLRLPVSQQALKNLERRDKFHQILPRHTKKNEGRRGNTSPLKSYKTGEQVARYYPRGSTITGDGGGMYSWDQLIKRTLELVIAAAAWAAYYSLLKHVM